MFKKKKVFDTTKYKELIKQIIIDKEIKKEITDVIKYFDKGNIYIDDNNLYGKISDKDGNDYIEIKYDNNKFSCIYTDWNSRKRVIITQDNLKENQKYINRTELCMTKTLPNTLENEKSSVRVEKIYNKDNILIFESTLKKEDRFDSTDNFMCYIDGCFDNEIKLNKRWYINNVIIQYNLEKKYLSKDLYEKYSICPGKISTDYENLYLFNKLEKELFIDFMTDKITIEEVLEQNKEKAEETAKQYFKNMGSIQYI